MSEPLDPLRFLPLFKPAIWGGNSLRPMLGYEASDERIGEAWLITDQGEQQSIVASGPYKGSSLRRLLEDDAERILGPSYAAYPRFPLLLKFIDAQQHLSIQVHPTDELARVLEPQGAGIGKTEAWVILQTDKKSRIWAGLKQIIAREDFRFAMETGTLPDLLHSFRPNVGECVFLPAGTIHAIGAGVLLFEVQQNSDITYRLYDWGRLDTKTGKPRALHIPEGLQCTNYASGACEPLRMVGDQTSEILEEQLVTCEYFRLFRHRASVPWTIPADQRCRVLVNVGGQTALLHRDVSFPFATGDVYLLPAERQETLVVPQGHATILDCRLPME